MRATFHHGLGQAGGAGTTPLLKPGPISLWDWAFMSEGEARTYCPSGYKVAREGWTGELSCLRSHTGDFIADQFFGTPPVESIAPVPVPSGPTATDMTSWTPEQLAYADAQRAVQERDILIPLRAQYETDPARSTAAVPPELASLLSGGNNAALEALEFELSPAVVVVGVGVGLAVLLSLNKR